MTADVAGQRHRRRLGAPGTEGGPARWARSTVPRGAHSSPPPPAGAGGGGLLDGLADPSAAGFPYEVGAVSDSASDGVSSDLPTIGAVAFSDPAPVSALTSISLNLASSARSLLSTVPR
jgi:hypothetical protein